MLCILFATVVSDTCEYMMPTFLPHITRTYIYSSTFNNMSSCLVVGQSSQSQVYSLGGGEGTELSDSFKLFIIGVPIYNNITDITYCFQYRLLCWQELPQPCILSPFHNWSESTTPDIASADGIPTFMEVFKYKTAGRKIGIFDLICLPINYIFYLLFRLELWTKSCYALLYSFITL